MTPVVCTFANFWNFNPVNQPAQSFVSLELVFTLW
jgi:hypothetical protein